jgi:hypothetical protein
MLRKRRQQKVSPVARGHREPRRKPLGFTEWTEAATRIIGDWRTAIEKNTPRPIDPQRWREAVARVCPEPIKRAKAKKQPALPSGPRPKFNRKKLKRLVDRHPGETNKELLIRYERETGDKPSLSWVRDRRQEFRRQKS